MSGRIWNALSIIRPLFPASAPEEERAAMAAAQDANLRWFKAATNCPELADDVIRISGLLTTRGVSPDPDGLPALDPLTPTDAAYQLGRADMAKQLLALMKCDPRALNMKMEND